MLFRIIPARAGFTTGCASAATPTWDHPRSRGVYWADMSEHVVLPGSSPLARGLRAGFTWSLRSGADHPRSRGVYIERDYFTIRPFGSSPLARGLQRRNHLGRPGAGIIPARAGFTGSQSCPHMRRRDHPRSRGVYALRAAAFGYRTGSSPLARGLRRARGRRPGGRRDHPRSRGVYSRPRPHSRGCAGSSPLARGLRRLPEETAAFRRIIPARAGFTPMSSLRPSRPSDHPRSRGVYLQVDPYGDAAHGSSPLARGLRADDRLISEMSRIIPARAGFTFLPAHALE